MSRNGFIFYESFEAAIATLPDPLDRVCAYQNIIRYALYGEEPEEQEGVGFAIFLMAKAQVDANNRKAENGQKGGRPPKPETEEKAPYNHPTTSSEPNENAKGKDNAKGKIKSEEVKPKEFIKPTLEEIQTYCFERKNNVDTKKFFDYFDASGWIDSEGKPVLNWKQKIITWEGGNRKKSVKPQTGVPSETYSGEAPL